MIPGCRNICRWQPWREHRQGMAVQGSVASVQMAAAGQRSEADKMSENKKKGEKGGRGREKRGEGRAEEERRRRKKRVWVGLPPAHRKLLAAKPSSGTPEPATEEHLAAPHTARGHPSSPFFVIALLRCSHSLMAWASNRLTASSHCVNRKSYRHLVLLRDAHLAKKHVWGHMLPKHAHCTL